MRKAFSLHDANMRQQCAFQCTIYIYKDRKDNSVILVILNIGCNYIVEHELLQIEILCNG